MFIIFRMSIWSMHMYFIAWCYSCCTAIRKHSEWRLRVPSFYNLTWIHWQFSIITVKRWDTVGTKINLYFFFLRHEEHKSIFSNCHAKSLKHGPRTIIVDLLHRSRQLIGASLKIARRRLHTCFAIRAFPYMVRFGQFCDISIGYWHVLS